MKYQPPPGRCPHFQRAIDTVSAFDGQDQTGLSTAIARLVAVNRRTVYGALHKATRCPATWAGPLAKATGIPRSKLRPDLYPPADESPAMLNPPSGLVWPAALEVQGQLCIPGTERKRSNVNQQ